ncbi:bifunctional UDP-N-acetylglucosamine diphosphorylase/glucosamine-1-phosphate N-acetyltransferase GlmU [Candidatus Dependentiae bacterium]|nr:bifunctional UDP-N-acetylglucosamine diphosphorylase/glucosamine-1-phosphate N-acetyltransferase GlmU [Candidatus Dependentiae bacterium]
MVTTGVRAVILAAGKSKRFKRRQSKLLAEICGRPMVVFPLRVLEELKISATLVLGYQADQIKDSIESFKMKHVDCVLQGEPLGTGNAVLCSQSRWDKENILILNADVPLLTPELIKQLLEKHKQSGAIMSFVSTHVINPTGYGRVVEQDGVTRIYEEKDCPSEYKSENRVNVGIYVVKRSFLQDGIQKLERSKVSGEIYLTDLVELASRRGEHVEIVGAPFDQVRGVNTLQELWAVEQVMRSNLIKHWMSNGVRFELAQGIHIDIDVEIGPDSFIGTGAHLLGRTKIGEGCFIAAFTILENTVVGDGTMVHSHCVVQDSVIGGDAHIGPFARLRNNVVVADNVCIGNFVEIKNSTIGYGSKTKHLSYVGDATLGDNVNIGAGTVFCNYDGSKKHKTIIENDVFIGSNNTLIAPVKLGEGAYAAAGSTITTDVPPQDLAIARARQENKGQYAKKFRGEEKKKEKVFCNKVCTSKKKDDERFHFLGAVKTHDMPEESV